MTTRVYQFGLRDPIENASLIAEQLLAAHRYRNELTAIERARRAAMRALEASPEVDEALRVLQALSNSEKAKRKEARKALREARRVARENVRARERYNDQWTEEAGCCPLYELERLEQLAAALVRGARALTLAFWGTYLDVEAAAQASRKAPLYDDTELEPLDPKFYAQRGNPGQLVDSGQIAVQIQRPVTTAGVRDGGCTFAKFDGKTLSVRIGSAGRAPIWGTWPVNASDHVRRVIPDDARWRWVRVSRRQEGPWRRYWTCEITVDLAGPTPRELATNLAGAIAVEVEWKREGDALRAATWRDSSGRTGVIYLPPRIASGLPKPDGIRSVRDKLRVGMVEHFVDVFKTSFDAKPAWLVDAVAAIEAGLWESPWKFYDLVRRWRAEKCDAAREAYDVLQEWELRDAHLWDYEAGARQNVLRWRKDFYRKLAAGWAREYRTVILDDRDLSREARFGEASDLRFAISPSELRGALYNAFGRDAVEWAYAPKDKADERGFCTRAIEAWAAGSIGGGSKPPDKTPGGAWAKRKAGKGKSKSSTALQSP